MNHANSRRIGNVLTRTAVPLPTAPTIAPIPTLVVSAATHDVSVNAQERPRRMRRRIDFVRPEIVTVADLIPPDPTIRAVPRTAVFDLVRRPSSLPGNPLKRRVVGLPVQPIIGDAVGAILPDETLVSDFPVSIEARGPRNRDALSDKQQSWPIALLSRDDVEHGGARFAPGAGLGDSDSEISVAAGNASVDMPKYSPTDRRSSSESAEVRRSLSALIAQLLPMLIPPAKAPTFDELSLPHSLYDFQIDGVQFLADREPGALLADDMGLGKTVQAIVALLLLFRRGAASRAVVIAPKAVTHSWARHFAAWAPDLVVDRVQGSAYERRAKWDAFAKGRSHVAVTTFASLRSDVHGGKVSLPEIDVLIVDEAQNVKNPSTQQSQAVKSISARRCWALTGTPLENSTADLHAILSLVDPRAMDRVSDSRPLRKATQKLMLRRRKEDVLDDLPAKFTHVEFVELGPRQREAYERAERDGIADLRGKPRDIPNVLALITRLKQICNEVDGESAKLEWLVDYAEASAAEEDKLLVYSQFVETLKVLEPRLGEHAPLSYTGQLNDRERQHRLEAFEEIDDHRIMLLSLRAGGVGLNLQTAANRVVHFDSWWNPAVQAQATGRVHRIGQKKTVFETVLVSSATIEERIQQMMERKRDLFRSAVDDLSVPGLARLASQDELYGLFDIDVKALPSAPP